jgi:hypothetical protein
MRNSDGELRSADAAFCWTEAHLKREMFAMRVSRKRPGGGKPTGPFPLPFNRDARPLRAASLGTAV